MLPVPQPPQNNWCVSPQRPAPDHIIYEVVTPFLWYEVKVPYETHHMATYERRDPTTNELINEITLYPDGILAVGVGFSWNGPTATPSFDAMMRGSAAHDAIYEMFGPLGTLQTGMTSTIYKQQADDMLVRMFEEDGVSCPTRAVASAGG